MNIFLTGASGYIGGSVAEKLIGNGFKVTGLVRSGERAKQVAAKGITPVVGTLDDQTLLSEISKDSDGVIHTADAEHYDSVIAIINGLRNSNKPFIHTSGSSIVSDKAQGNHSDLIFDENTDFEPLPGRVNRVKINQVVIDSFSSGIRSIVIAPSLIYGNGLGLNPNSMQVPWLVKLAKRLGRAHHIGKGENIWANVHIDDVCDLYLLALSNSFGGQFYFAENGENSMLDACTFINQALGFPNPPEKLNMEEACNEWGENVANYTMGSNSRVRAKNARARLGWEPLGPSLREFLGLSKNRM